MTTEEAQKVLNELDNVRPEVLTGEAKRLFEAIMTIADERDEMKKENAFLQGKITALIRIKKDLETQRDYYKARYLEFNNAFINFKKEDKQ